VQLAVGTYRFLPDTVVTRTGLRTLHDDFSNPVGRRITLVAEGRLEGDGQTAITSASVSLENALAIPFPDITLYQTNGAPAWSMLNAGSIAGVRITELEYPEGEGAEYAQYRTFRLKAEADYPTGFGSLLLSFTETVTFYGGGPVRGFLEPIHGPPIPQTIKEFTPYFAEQVGQATALRTWPEPAAPLWPTALLEKGRKPYTSPQRVPRGLGFTVGWAYRFGSPGPLNGRPRVLVGSGGGGGG
jgi:hypothetical protein